jgi:hypothetical protein
LVSLHDPRVRRDDSRLLAKDPIGQDDTRRAQIERDWKFIERLRWAIQSGHETAAGVLGHVRREKD